MGNSLYTIPDVLRQAHHIVEFALQRVPEEESRLALDATAGNGHDTLFLAQAVGATGAVVACDIQKSALAATKERLEREGLLSRARLQCVGHERLHEFLDCAWEGKIAAIMANLGYLPGGDKRMITEPDTTLMMLRTLLPMLRSNGVMTIVAYGGHSGGEAEVRAVHDDLCSLSQEAWRVLAYGFLNQRGTPPVLYAIERV